MKLPGNYKYKETEMLSTFITTTTKKPNSFQKHAILEIHTRAVKNLENANLKKSQCVKLQLS